jgi:hypothetical protein
MTLLFEMPMADGRWSITGSAAAFFVKRPAPPEFQQSEIKNQKSEIALCAGGAV